MTGEDNGTDPEFGPSGYLPQRAADRARKIVLRSPLGLQWVVGAVVVAVAIAVVAVVFFVTRSDPAPGPPFVEVGPVEAVDDARYDADREVLYVGAVGPVRTFAVDADDVPVWCAESRRLESPAGRVWHATGRALDGGASLDQYPTVVVEGIVYVDLTRLEPGPPPRDDGAEPACF